MLNGILLLDKPEGFTSHDAVAKLRGMLRQKRIGHAGTLDPLATGLLVVLLGNATRASDQAAGQQKEYLARLRLGLETDTEDITGQTLAQQPVTVGREDLQAILPRFTGEILQRPPMYSALQVDGKRLYAGPQGRGGGAGGPAHHRLAAFAAAPGRRAAGGGL